MEIEDVEAVPIRRELDGRFANAQKWIGSREYCLVRVTAADGTVGWGECWGPVAGNREVIEEYVAPWLRGREVEGVEQVHDDLRFALRSSYHSYLPVSALSGVDIALWDLYGKRLGVPAAELLGGRRREAVPAYATGHFWPDVDSFEAVRESVVEEAVGHVEAGFGALKNKIGMTRHPEFPYGWEEDVELVRAIREAVGDDVLLATDANHAYDRATAERVGHALADFDVHFFEEPIEPRRLDGYVDLNAAIEVPVAGGECWAFEGGFEEVVRRGGVAYAQPDVTSAGGLTATRRIAALAAAHNVQCLPHVFGSAVALAASLQALAAIPGDPMLEFDRTPNPIRDELAVDPVELDGTSVPIPDRPGIGVEIDPDVLAEFRAD
ncbi:mandelate racemase/muconate lactonizing enzyme family protein [Halorarum salinum]|uniref:Mandelate racemase/muconate lactonizing enzyme family protein n=1 Tax=Halorarum salinum TaxID=2743089 RepID=A0A7D5QCZ9_9EURY|nr:mandelate racemase/muconate lactonizing enzyme family protein [Halobaculum salinum]QLG63459.1 mandelate racemase/muconate lactonizing enzyme family protein [Halobaculum salinum]